MTFSANPIYAKYIFYDYPNLFWYIFKPINFVHKRATKEIFIFLMIIMIKLH